MTTTTEERRFLLYSHDGYGLGHLRRNLGVAGRLVRDLPGASAVVLAGLPGIPGLVLPPGVDLVKLPSIQKVATETWHPRTLRVEQARLSAMRRAVIGGLAATFEPHLMLVDYMPAGVWGELVPALTELRARIPATRTVLGLRDVLDAPDVTRTAWDTTGHADALRTLYDHVLVYGEPDVFDTVRAYGLDELLPGRIEYTGYLCAETAPGEPAGVRDRLGLQASEPLVLVTAGGGADAYPMISLTLRALARLGPHAPRTLVVTGPLMPRDQVTALQDLAAGLPVTVSCETREMADLMAAANLVVTMASYNTLTEAIRMRRTILSIPRRGPSAEQVTRAALLAARGLLTHVASDETPEGLASLMTNSLQRPRLLPPAPALDGLERTAAALRRLVAEKPPRSTRPALGAARGTTRGSRTVQPRHA